MSITPFVFTLTLLVVLALAQAVGMIGYWMINRPGMAIMFFGFVIGNCGMILDVIQMSKT